MFAGQKRALLCDHAGLNAIFRTVSEEPGEGLSRADLTFGAPVEIDPTGA